MNFVRNLEPKWYICPQIYEKEKAQIFKPSWWLLGPTRQLLEVGDYICDKVCGWPVFAVRSNDGEIRAFLNTCRHRGASLLQAGRGRVSSIRCPYHGWLYDNQGKLLTAPYFDQHIYAEHNDVNLYQIEVEVWNNLVFVKIDNVRDENLTQWLGEIVDLVEQHPSPNDLDFQGRFDVAGELNWKTYCDNTVEGYHLNLIHPRLGKSLAGGKVELFSVNAGRSVIFDVEYGSVGSDLRGRKGMWIYHFPGLQFVLGPKVFKAERVESEHQSLVRSVNWAWYGSSLSDEEKLDSFIWAEQIVQEDFRICENVTKNMQAGTYFPGPLSPQKEQHLARFQQIVQEYVNPID